MADDPERRWLTEVYRPNDPQLTVRAVVTGMLLGAVMCALNLYVVLKTGWSLGVTITASILAYAIWRGFHAVGLTRREFGILENNAMASVASAAGYMTGGGNMAALPALLMLTLVRPDPVWLVFWFAVIAALGVFTAIPIKRQLINVEQLAFPTGSATGDTLKSLHTHGQEGVSKALLLGIATAFGAVLKVFTELKIAVLGFVVPSSFGLPFSILGQTAAKWTLALENSVLLFGAGAFMSFRTGWSMLLGGAITYGWLAPAMFERGVIAAVSYKVIVQWTLWPGAAVLLSSGLLSFGFQWPSIAKSFRQLGQLVRKTRVEEDDPLAAVECPPSWFPLAYLVLGPIMVFLMWKMFGIPWWAGVISLVLAVLMASVASRVTGETDTTPTKALGPVTQAVYGVMRPGDLPANLMGANVTGGIGLHAADLLTDLKSGYIVGANPRKQLICQLFGVVAGALAVVPVFNLVIPDPSLLGTDAWPAPSVQVWAGVSQVFVEGIGAMHPTARIAALVGAIVGVVLVLLERLLPPRLRAFVPSPSGVGIAMVIPAFNSFAMALGAFVAEGIRRARPALAEKAVLPVASGFIAGESLMGLVLAVLLLFGIISK
jgi:OPT family oligopeptide transporter